MNTVRRLSTATALILGATVVTPAMASAAPARHAVGTAMSIHRAAQHSRADHARLQVVGHGIGTAVTIHR